MEHKSAAMKPHAVCVAFPYQSHINAMLKLAKLLHSRGFHITFVNTEFHHRKILNSSGPDSLRGLHNFQFETIPDGLPFSDLDDTQDLETLLGSMVETGLQSVSSLISRLNEASLSSGVPRVSCLVADSTISSMLEAGEEFGIPGVLLWPMSGSVLLAYLHSNEIIEKIHLLPKEEGKEYLNTLVDFIPGIKNIRIKDLSSFFWDNSGDINKLAIQEIQKSSKASAVILNTFDALEPEVLGALKSILPNIYTIGPMQLLEEQIPNKLYSFKPNLWKEDQDCLKWLDSQRPNSVIYVNFGSSTVMTAHQLTEFAWGLANCEHPFLWVIRPGIVAGEVATLPAEFSKETANRGMISGWCPQEQVLQHSSVCGFLTHSGWNSMMDTLCGGVPIFSWPFLGDQPTNSRYACAHWGFGMEIDTDAKKEVVQGVLKGIVEGEKWKEMKRNVLGWSESARKSAKSGGSSYLNLEKVVDIMSHKKLDRGTGDLILNKSPVAVNAYHRNPPSNSVLISLELYMSVLSVSLEGN